MFRVRFTVQLFSDTDNKHAFLERLVDLPFPPFVGLVVWWPEASPSDENANTVQRVSWVVSESLFECQVRLDHGNEPLAVIVKFWTDCGWSVADAA